MELFTTSMLRSSIRSHPMQSDEDYWRMRALLIETVPITPIGFNWDVRRLDGKRFYNEDLEANRLLARPVRLWETGGDLIAYVLPEGTGDAHLQVHPDYRHLEEEMIDWAEQNLTAAGEDGRQRQLHIYVNEYDAHRQRLLGASGWKKMSYGGMIRHMRIGQQPIREPVFAERAHSAIAEGYTLRTTNPDHLADCQQIADLLNAAFGRTFHNAAEYQNFTRNAPCFHRDLDLVMVAPDGAFAAYVGIPYDDVNRRGIFEPVCTHPNHQRRGLGKALMLEGLHRLRAVGAVDVTVDTGDMIAANALYSSIGFTEAYKGFYLRKQCD